MLNAVRGRTPEFPIIEKDYLVRTCHFASAIQEAFFSSKFKSSSTKGTPYQSDFSGYYYLGQLRDTHACLDTTPSIPPRQMRPAWLPEGVHHS